MRELGMRLLIPALLLAAALPVTAVASPVTYNAVTQFSTTHGNPNGVWSYGGGVPGSSFFLDDHVATSGTAVLWADSTGTNGFQPIVGYNASGADISTTRAPATDLLLHPGNSSTLAATLMFTAPSSGVYTATGLFERLDKVVGGGNGVIVSIYDGSTALLGPTAISSINYVPVSFTFAQYLAAGQTLTFNVAYPGNYDYDTTGLQLSVVAPTPEPSSLLLLGTGVLGAVGAARRKIFRA